MEIPFLRKGKCRTKLFVWSRQNLARAL